MSFGDDKSTRSPSQTPIEDNGNPAEPKLANSTPSDLVHQLPALSGEQAVTQEEGQEIVGTRSVTATLATSWRKLLPENNMTNFASTKVGGRETRGGNWRTMREWMWHRCWAHRSGWEPKSLLYWNQSWKLIEKKTRPSSHGDLSHAVAHAVYLYSSCWTVSPSGLYAECLCFLIFVDVRWLLFWTWSQLYLGLLTSGHFD